VDESSAAAVASSNGNQNTTFQGSRGGGKSNAENIFNSSYSNSNTPQTGCLPPAPTRKISLQPLNQHTPRTSQNNSPIDMYPSHNHSRSNYSNNNNFNNNTSMSNNRRGSNFSFPSNNSTPSMISPRNTYHNQQHNNSGFPPPAPSANYSSKLVGKPQPTLFDYIVTPIKSPGQLMQQQQLGKVAEQQQQTPLINDFKQRFSQHQHSMNSSRASVSFGNVSYSNSVVSTPVNTSSASNIITNNSVVGASGGVEKQEIELVETKASEAKPKVDFSNLGPLIRKALSESDIERVSILAKLYTQLILNNFIVTINIELFFLFQLLTLNSIEDKNESQFLGK
jgi:hypothetical protein